MFDLLYLAPMGSLLALGFAGFLAWTVMKRDEGTPLMREIAQAVKEGAAAYLKRQYTIVAIFFAVVFVILNILVKLGNLAPVVPFAFLTGGLFSGLCGFLGMKMATNASARTTNAAQKR